LALKIDFGCIIKWIGKTDLEKKSDEQLVSISLHDIAAFEIIVKRWEKKVFFYINRLIGWRGEDAEDITQDVFIKVYKNLGSFNIKLKFSSWLYRVAHNEAINFIKKNKNKNTISIENNLYLTNTLASNEDVVQDIIARQENINISQTLLKLSLKDRVPLILHYIEDKSYLEIADILHISKNSVGPKIKRSKNKLRKILEKEHNAKPRRFKASHRSDKKRQN